LSPATDDPERFRYDLFRPDPDARAGLRSDWGVRDEALIGLVGRLAEGKGHRTFLEAAGLLARRHPDVRFVIIGGGAPAKGDELELVTLELGLGPRLLWFEFREDMRAIYNALDVLCSASHREGFPNVIGEAMACGVPCVVTEVGASAELVGGSGIVVPPGEPALLADALEEMLRRLPSIQPLRIRESITSRFSVERCVEATEVALKEARSTA
jgi:glycosyltransferase involved in cell wall biosynthesis